MTHETAVSWDAYCVFCKGIIFANVEHYEGKSSYGKWKKQLKPRTRTQAFVDGRKRTFTVRAHIGCYVNA